MSRYQTLAFLKLLEHDLPDQVVCEFCGKLHRIRDAKKYVKKFAPVREPHCLFIDHMFSVAELIHENFSTTLFKMTMKHYHRFGYDAQSRQLLNLLSKKSHTNVWAKGSKKEKAECQIKNGSLFTERHIDFRGTCTDLERNRYPIIFRICPHLEVKSVPCLAGLRITTSYPLPIEKKWSALLHFWNGTNIKKISWDLCSELQQCVYCRTEYKTGLKHGFSCTFKFTITIWKDLGQGPEGEEWKSLIANENWPPEPIQFQGGEIASIFQKGRSDWARD